MTQTNQGTPILFVHYGEDWIRGSERCLLDLLSHLDRTRFSPMVWCNSMQLASQIKKLGITVIQQPFPLLLGWQAPAYDIFAFFALVSKGITLIQHHQIKLIHSNSGAPCQWLNLVARKTRVPLIAHLHCRYPLRDRISLGLHHVSHLIAVSHPVAQQYIDDGFDQNRLGVIANGIDPQRLKINQNIKIKQFLKLDKNDFILMSAGSLIARKGMDILINALVLVRQHHIPAKLIIVGEGPCHAQLKQRINALGVGQHVFLLGERSDLSSLLQSGIDLFISGATEEVFGLVLAEAGLHNIPVIAPDVGGISEVIKHHHSGLLVPPQAPQQIAQAIELLYLRPDLRRQFGHAAKARIEKLFLIKKHVTAVESLYFKMLSKPMHALTWHSHWSMLAVATSIIHFALKRLITHKESI